MLRTSISVLFTLVTFSVLSQPVSMSSSDIKHQMEKLGVIGNVMYFAAHPDDENTRLIAWLAKHEKYRTCYFSLTRGGGGQNLIGDEKGELLGILRSQELQMARSIDGGEQYFSRAMDFGYTKSVDEAFEKWNQDQLVGDAVARIRQFKPDVIITRFPPDKRAGHGQHTASAVVAQLAFDAAGDKKQYPESADAYGVWQPKRLFFNTHPWMDKTIEDRKDQLLIVNVGAYDPLLGQSYTEIAAEARSQHRCQAFGTAKQRGDRPEYLELVDGDPLVDKALFDGIDANWNRVKGGDEIQEMIIHLNETFNYSDPAESLERLALIYERIKELKDFPWKEEKLKDVEELMRACGGLHLEYLANQAMVVAGQPVEVSYEAIMQGSFAGTLKEIRVGDEIITVNEELSNSLLKIQDTLVLGDVYSQPYWLENRTEQDLYTMPNGDLAGLPENPAVSQAIFVFESVFGNLELPVDIQYKWVDRAIGELYRPVALVPGAGASIEHNVYVYPNDSVQTVNVRVVAYGNYDNVSVKPVLPPGWESDVTDTVLDSIRVGRVYDLSFAVRPGESAQTGDISVNVVLDGKEVNRQVIEIAYEHIPTQVVMPVNRASLVRSDIQINGSSIGYITGAGDEVPAALRRMGFEVTMLDPAKVTRLELDNYDAIVAGIRAYNTIENMEGLHGLLMDYVHEGGRYVVQYNTSYSLKSSELGPYPIALGRGRVTDEYATPTFLQRDHPVYNYPNQLTEADFEGWVQERGLYFPKEWDERYTELIAWNDKGEDPLQGSLLVAEYGQGTFVYTGISFFRELPAGVSGAFRLFANLVSSPEPVETEIE